MKVYLHLEDPPPVTVVISTEDPTYTVLSAVKEFCKEAAKHAKRLDPENVTVQKKSGKSLAVSACLKDVVSNRDDLWLQVAKESIKAPPKPQSKVEEEKPKPRNEVKRFLKKAQRFCKEKQEREAVNVYEEILKLELQHMESLLAIGDIYLAANRPKKAKKYYSKAQKYHPRELQVQYKLAQCYLAMEKGDEALEILMDYGKQLRQKGGTTEEEKFSLQVALCKAYQAKGQKDMAIVLAQGVVRQSREYIPGLVEFAKLTYELGELQAYEAITVLLTATVMHRGDRYIARTFAEACQKPGGLEHLQKSAAESWNNANAVIFLANTLRDNGAVQEAVTLLEHVLELEPNHIGANLIYVHNLEILQQYERAVAAVRQFLESFPPLAVDGVSNSDILAVLNGQTPQPEDVDKSGPPKNLHLLALWFTLVKILYFHNQTTALRQLVDLLGPLHTDRGLHLTVIRNEAAYFSCIYQVVTSCEAIAPPVEGEKTVYFISDSHSTTPAWRHINIKGERHRIRPSLCTGTKIWHLRPESVFYPKSSFYNAIATVPKAATVIVCLGEIDCREGLLRAVERCKYDSVEEAMERAIDIYMTVLNDLQLQNDWNISVHPVVPVLDVTRFQVVEFNRRLAARLSKEAHLHWLDFADQLLENGKLKPEYEFDGTHLHPRYLPLLEEALNNAS